MTERSDTGSVGARLKQARESKRVTLRQIANTTRIAVSALDAIERDDVKKLPGGIFARSFVRAYASELKLDVEQTVAEFFAQFPEPVDGPAADRRRPKLTTARRSACPPASCAGPCWRFRRSLSSAGWCLAAAARRPRVPSRRWLPSARPLLDRTFRHPCPHVLRLTSCLPVARSLTRRPPCRHLP